MKRSLALALAITLGTTAVMAQDPIAQRKEQFKAWGAAVREPGAMLRGEAAFDLAKVQAALKLIGDTAPTMAARFPAGSDKGDTKALPVIWEKKAEFDAIFTKLSGDAKAAAAAVKDEASYKAEMGKVLGNCGACHNTFRAK
jgi:cytochrome c556